MAKWVFYVLVFVYMCYRAVYGARVIDTSISVEQIDYEEIDFLEVGSRKTIACKAPNKNYKLDWLDPSGNSVKRIPSSRVYAQEHFVSTPKGNRIPGLVLTFADLQVSDSGVYQCKSGQQKRGVRVCVIKPAEFVESSDTPAEVTIEAGRAITLSCQANGDPEPKLVWTRNDVILTENEKDPKYLINKRYKIDGYESLLTITSVAPSDGGLYNCVAEQESVMLENCTTASIKNVTLLVNHVPTFKHGNDVEYVYGKVNEIVEITCEARGYPKPTYRFFKDLGGGSLYEFDKSKIVFSEETNTATLPVTAGPTSFGNTYKCTASNIFGDQDKYFKLIRREKPWKPDQVKPVIITNSRVLLNVSWDEEIYFPVDQIRLRYLTGSSGKAEEVIKEVEDLDEDNELYSEYGILIELDGLNSDTKHILSLRAENAAGVSPWSGELTFSTTSEAESDVIVAEEEAEEAEKEESIVKEDDQGTDTGMFYGIFFTGAILIVAVVCMFAMRLV